MEAFVQLHRDRDQIQNSLRNTNLKELSDVFVATENQILSNHLEIAGVAKKICPWKSCSSLHGTIYKEFTAKVSVFSDSMICLGKMKPHSEAAKGGTNQLVHSDPVIQKSG